MGARILIIKLGALGDFVQALGPMAAIRKHHAGASVTLLTSKPYVDFAKASGLFDEVWIDEERPKAWQIGRVRRLRQKLKSARSTSVIPACANWSRWRSMVCMSLRWGLSCGWEHPRAMPDHCGREPGPRM